jgi:hypothetical protein
LQDIVLLRSLLAAYNINIPLSIHDTLFVHGFTKLDENNRTTSSFALHYLRKLKAWSAIIELQALYFPSGFGQLYSQNCFGSIIQMQKKVAQQSFISASVLGVLGLHDQASSKLGGYDISLQHTFRQDSTAILKFFNYEDKSHIQLQLDRSINKVTNAMTLSNITASLQSSV